MTSSAEKPFGGGIIVDAVHGDIHLKPRELDVLDTASFQRLRHIKQLGMGQVTYPNATHTRFAHSIGVLGIMARVLDVASDRLGLDDRQEENLRLAALLHDIGQYPYSHMMEGMRATRLTEEEFGESPSSERTAGPEEPEFPDHESLGHLIVTHQEDLIKALGGLERAEEIARIFTRQDTASLQISKLIHSSLDMDRLDYLLRDSQACGVPYGQVDINYILNNLKASPGGMVGITSKALPAAEHVLLARYYMHRTVYYHKTTFGMEEACRHLLRRIRGREEYGIPRHGGEVSEIVKGAGLLTFTDAMVDRAVREAAHDSDQVVAALAGAILNRRPPKLLKEVCILAQRGEAHHEGKGFRTDCKHRLGGLAKQFGIPLGQFIFCQTRPLRLEQRGGHMTADEARDMPSEQEDELIKVFKDGEEEPTSMVDVPNTWLEVLGAYFFQAFRLYVVCDGEEQAGKVADMREDVKSWDKV